MTGARSGPHFEIEAARRIRDASGAAAEPRHDSVAVRVDEVDEEAAAAREVRGERQAEQAALTAGEHPPAQVQEILGDDAVAHHANAAGLLDGIKDRRIARVGDERDQRLQAAREYE